MTIFHNTCFQCDGCHFNIECSSHTIPNLVAELIKEGWIFNYDLWHNDYCPVCVGLGAPKANRDHLLSVMSTK